MTIEIRPSLMEEGDHLRKWLDDPAVLRWFPMMNGREIDDAVRLWINYSKLGACFTALIDGAPAGMGTLYLQPYEKLAHQCLFAIIVDEKHRGKGIGKALLTHMMEVASSQFKIELLHLEVYEGNPAQRLYERLGFEEYGRHPRFIKMENGEYLTKIMMQKRL